MTMSDFVIKDSGERESFDTGAVRDISGTKPRPDLISPFFLERLGEHMRKGAEKYREWNWAKGIPSSRCYESAMRHLMYYAQGAVDEDHLAAAAFNIMAIIHNEEVAHRDIVLRTKPGYMNNMPRFYSEAAPGESMTDRIIRLAKDLIERVKKSNKDFETDEYFFTVPHSIYEELSMGSSADVELFEIPVEDGGEDCRVIILHVPGDNLKTKCSCEV